MNYGMNTPCMTCHQKNDTYLYHQLHSLYLDLAHSIEPINDYYEKFYWNNNVKCKYGIYCNEPSGTYEMLGGILLSPKKTAFSL